MGAPFNQWLARPSTICFLRRLVATTEKDCQAARGKRRPYTSQSNRCNEPSSDDKIPDNNIGDGDIPASKHFALRNEEGVQEEIRTTGLPVSAIIGENSVDRDPPHEQAFKALWMQANVTSERTRARLVVDRLEHRQNYKLWIELLDSRQRMDGFFGVADVWKGMRYRKVDLPTSGEDADVLWPALINACISTDHDKKHQDLLDSIVEHAKDLQARLGTRYRGLYRCIVGRWLRIYPSVAGDWHTSLTTHPDLCDIDLRTLAPDCALSIDPLNTQKFFRRIYLSSKQRDLYDHFIPELLKRKNVENSLRWHRLFLRKTDGPSSEVFGMPEVQLLFQLDEDKSLPMVHSKRLPKPGSSSADDAHPNSQYPALTRATMSALVGDAHGIKQKEFSEGFMARVFATQAFSLALVMKSLSFFAIDRLGPVALRELAVKAGNYPEFCNCLQELKAAGVNIQISSYGRLVHRLVEDGLEPLFDTLLASDQHPESFDDYETQELLLASFLEKGDVRNAHIASICLSLAGKTQDAKAWNRILQYYIGKRLYHTVRQIMLQIQTSDMSLTRPTLLHLGDYVLPPRHLGKAPEQAGEASVLQPLQFTTNAYMYAATHGTLVYPSQWVEVLKRFAMTHLWDEFERLVRWLVSHYAHMNSVKDESERHLQTLRGRRTLQTIFYHNMQKAIVTWGFQDASHHGQLKPQPLHVYFSRRGNRLSADIPCEPWAKGIWLLKYLRDEGLPVYSELVRDALKLRLWILFGPGFSTKAKNHEMKRKNELSLASYIRHANEIWDRKLFNVRNALLDDSPASNAKLMVAVFGTEFSVNVRTNEYADVAKYARIHASKKPLPDHPNVRIKKRIWELSPFRIVKAPLDEISDSPTAPPQHPPPAAHSSNSRPPPNPRDTPESSAPYSPLPPRAPPE